jgi:hypothetical protein
MEKMFRLWVVVVSTLLIGVTAAAQEVDLAAGGSDQVWNGAAANNFAGFWLGQGAVSGGDSRRDLIVGAPGTASLAGVVYIIYGGPLGNAVNPLSTASVVISSSTVGTGFGWSTASGNITNQEGTVPRNLVVGAPSAAGGSGQVFLFNGGFVEGLRTTSASARFVITGAPGDRIGTAVATADLDDDNYREIIIGAAGNNRIYIIKGGPGLTGTLDLSVSPVMTISGGTASIGNVLATGDIDGDTIDDLLLGAPDNNGVFLKKGGFFIGGAQTLAGWALWAGEPGDRLGATIRVMNADGASQNDVLLGAPGNGTGKAYLIWGSATIANKSMANADVMFWGPVGYHIGDVITSGDINRDTPDDVVLVATTFDNAFSKVLVYYGRAKSRFGTQQADGRRLVNLDTPGTASFAYNGNSAGGPVTTVTVFEVTGEGAHDIIAGVPAANSNAGVVYFTLSPKMRLNLSTLNLTLPEGQTSTSATINVTNLSSVPITWQTGLTAPWLATSVNSGSAFSGSPGQFTVTVNAEGLTEGTYQAAANVSSTSPHLTMTLPITVNLTVTNSRYVVIDGPAAGGTYSQPATITGYAIDVGVPTGTGVNLVEIWAYPTPGSGAPAFLVGTATYGSARPSVGATYGARFANSGFTFSASRLAPGTYKFEARARSSATGAMWSKTTGTVTVGVQRLASPLDFNSDGMTDLVLQHEDTGCMVLWQMNGVSLIAQQWITPNCVDPSWRISGYADFDKDGKMDLLFQNVSSGQILVWLLNGTTLKEQLWLSAQPSTSAWRVAALGDFDGDSKVDVILQNRDDGRMLAWLLNGAKGVTLKLQQFLSPSAADPNWRIVGTGDIDGDGKPDLFFKHATSGYMVAWLMNGTSFVAQDWISPSQVGPEWAIASIGDFNGDSRPDLILQNTVNGWTVAWPLRGFALTGQLWLSPQVADPKWRIAGPR